MTWVTWVGTKTPKNLQLTITKENPSETLSKSHDMLIFWPQINYQGSLIEESKNGEGEIYNYPIMCSSPNMIICVLLKKKALK